MISVLLAGIILTANATQPADQPAPQPPAQQIHVIVQQQAVVQPTVMHSTAPPQPTITQLKILEATSGEVYSVQINDGETCTAPCVLNVPSNQKKTIITFIGPNRTVKQRINVYGHEMSLRMTREGSAGMNIGGGLMLGFGVPIMVGGLVLTTTGLLADSGALAGSGVPLALVGLGLTIGGGILRSKGRLKFEQNVSSTYADRSLDSKQIIQDSLQFAIVPMSKGLTAGAGFNF